MLRSPSQHDSSVVIGLPVLHCRLLNPVALSTWMPAPHRVATAKAVAMPIAVIYTVLGFALLLGIMARLARRTFRRTRSAHRRKACIKHPNIILDLDVDAALAAHCRSLVNTSFPARRSLNEYIPPGVDLSHSHMS
jgi:hypothetical protein